MALAVRLGLRTNLKLKYEALALATDSRRYFLMVLLAIAHDCLSPSPILPFARPLFRVKHEEQLFQSNFFDNMEKLLRRCDLGVTAALPTLPEVFCYRY